MIWLWTILGILAGVVALVVAVGALLPKGHVAAARARFDRPPQTVWDVISDYAGQPKWRKELKAVEVVSDENGQPVWKEISRGQTLTLQRVEADPPRRKVGRIADPKLPFGGRWVYELAAVGGGCVLTITEEGEVYNPVFRFVSHFFLDMGATIELYLKQLGRHMGQDVAVERVTTASAGGR